MTADLRPIDSLSSVSKDNALDGACSATSEAASESCPISADSLLKTPVKKETLIDRFDCIVIGTAFALAACHVMSKWSFAQNFTHQDATLLFTHTWSLPVISICIYLLMVHVLGPIIRRSSSPLISDKLIKEALKYWNLFLALLSICMLFGMGIPLIEFTWKYGLIESMCDGFKRRWGGPAFVWMYVFTLSKFVELFDTFFLVIRGKPVSFLHWYHHTSVLAYTWFAVVVGFCPGWFFATINSGVHTIMYFYYYRSACGVRLTYDRLITTCQIAQMVIGVAVTCTWAIIHYVMKNGSEICPCDHSASAMASALFMYGSYFMLFLSFYLKRYRSNQAAKRAAAVEAKKIK